MSRRDGRHNLPAGSHGGFTLLEILVAIFIFAIVITTVFGSFRAVFFSADAVGSDVAVFQNARTCLDRMARDLGAIYITDYPRYRKPEFNDPPDIYRVVGDTTDVAGKNFSRLRFASLAHLALHGDSRRGVCRVVYYVHQGRDDSLVLRRADHLYPFPEFEENDDDPILCNNLLGLEFSYGDADEEATGAWDSESADNDYATPHTVTVRLTVGQPSRPITFTTRIPLHVYRKTAE